jgi:hypothetical protein
MNKFYNLIFPLLLGSVLLIASISVIIDDTGIDLTKSNVVVGQVKTAKIIYILSSSRKKTYDIIFDFTLTTSSENFIVYRSYENYSDLQTSMQIGDTVKVYYKQSSFDDRNVLQIEKRSQVLQKYLSYNEDASTLAFSFLVFGILFIAIALIGYFHFNVFKFLDSLVDV